MALPSTTQALLNQITDPFGVYCLLEVRTANGSLYHVFPVMPESLAISQRYLATVTPTQGGAFVDDYGRAPSPVMMQGTFGRSPRPAIALGQEAALKNAQFFTGANGIAGDTSLPDRLNGYMLMKLLGEMVELSHVPDEQGNLPTCIFYNFAFGAIYEVNLESFEATMTMERNGLWIYQLQMTMLRRINGAAYDSTIAFERPDTAQSAYEQSIRYFEVPPTFIPPRPIEQDPRAPERLQVMFDAVTRNVTKFNQVTGYINSLRGADLIALASTKADQMLDLRIGTVGTFLNQVRNIPLMLSQVRSVINTVGNRLPRELGLELSALAGSVGALSTALIPRLNEPSLVQTIATTVQTIPWPRLGLSLDTADAMASTRPLVLTRPDTAAAELSEVVLTAEEALNAMTTLLATYGATDGALTSGSSVFAVMPDEGSTTSSRVHTIMQNDTLASVARTYYGNENEWTRLLTANRALFGDPLSLTNSFGEITATDTLNAFLGQALTVPTGSALTNDLIPDVWDNPIGVRAMGTDLPETLETRLRSDGTAELHVLEPLETLLQGVAHRLQVRQGSLPDDPRFGSRIPTMIGETFGALDLPMNQSRVAEALALEPRLASVNRVEVALEQSTLRIAFDAEARNAGNLGLINLNVSRQTP